MSVEMFMIAIFQKITINNHPVLQIFQEVRISISALNPKIYSRISSNQKSKIKLSALDMITVHIRLKKKATNSY